MSRRLLQEFIHLILESGYDDGRIKRSAKPDEWRSNRDEAFEAEVEALMDEPEYETIEAFVNHKLDNDEYVFNTVELQALARSADNARTGAQVSVASAMTTAAIKRELTTDFGFRFEPRAPVKFNRGSMSSSHGSHPFAGSGAGGSGFGSGFDGPTFISYGGGPGAIGGGYAWDKNDSKNLPMGSKRARR
jgi:hypothetical protein